MSISPPVVRVEAGGVSLAVTVRRWAFVAFWNKTIRWSGARRRATSARPRQLAYKEGQGEGAKFGQGQMPKFLSTCQVPGNVFRHVCHPPLPSACHCPGLCRARAREPERAQREREVGHDHAGSREAGISLARRFAQVQVPLSC